MSLLLAIVLKVTVHISVPDSRAKKTEKITINLREGNKRETKLIYTGKQK